MKKESVLEAVTAISCTARRFPVLSNEVYIAKCMMNTLNIDSAPNPGTARRNIKKISIKRNAADLEREIAATRRSAIAAKVKNNSPKRQARNEEL